MIPKRPNSSYAATFQTRHNHTGGAPLTQAGGQLINRRDSGPGPNGSTNRKVKPEPATDDEPLSSTDESEQLNSHSELSPSTEPTWKSYSRSPKEAASRSAGNTRVDADLYGEDDKRPPKRRKKGIDTPRKGERRSGRVKPSLPTSPKETPRKPIFMESDSLFSPYRPPPTKRQYGATNIHAAPSRKSSKHFEVPASTAEDGQSAIHSSQVSSNGPKFKTPLSFPNEVTSSASLFTGTSHFDDYDDDGDSSLSSLSSISSSISLHLAEAEKHELDCATPRQKAIICPMCDQAVDPRFIDDLRSPKNLSYRKKAQFCRDHRIRAAEYEWANRGYPTINWENLHKRIEKHYVELDQILTMKKSSFYRNELESSRTGKKKGNLRLTVDEDEADKFLPGYYGPWGAKKMMDAIISHFAGKFKHLAPTDHLIKAAGVSGFVQSVMVPELAVMLVKEDMGLDDAGARQVLTDSMEIGNLINKQPDDVIKQVGRQ
ncbi:hypothetical protein BDDG_01992 [Blastomyces dermatitidis ATCC 18188]|uniref:Restriction of telomere capping protein 4 n=1 Tax=Ajellomyces dermatitidis (strain ATCC 18188 / CBS 674.68) TaxID=653446 RepID=F2T741_AJEDA|nr:hypothetical protein BDDG_01992 [Blastomyces dermatitidis ATCC 18188]EQL37168.1 hypothetical protein BDFG_01440 [Blastomyces dermatitidis ATCC 26199]